MLVDNIDELRASFRAARERKPFTVEAIVILPDHLHAILTLPPDDSDFAGRWRAIKATFTRLVVAGGAPTSRDYRGRYDLWQRRFWEHTIRDEADFERCADYIHYNPVRHGLVSAPANWRFSSLHRYVRAGVLPADWGGSLCTIEGNFGEPPDLAGSIRRQTGV